MKTAKNILGLQLATDPRWVDLAEKWGAQMAFAGESIKTK